MRVSLFVTCMVDLFEPEVAASAVKVLRRIGASVEVPEGQTCCGQPAWNSGFANDAARVAAASLDALVAADASAVVVPAGSCATMMKVFWPELFEIAGDHDRSEQARRLAPRIHEFSEFVDERSERLAPMIDLDDNAAYHHSCHMLRELRIEHAPEALLRAAGNDPVAWEADRRCCGFGGIFSMKLPETSEAMADEKLESLEAAGCRDLVGCDTSCLVHLRTRAEHQGRPIRVRHLAQVLAAALGPESDR